MPAKTYLSVFSTGQWRQTVAALPSQANLDALWHWVPDPSTPESFQHLFYNPAYFFQHPFCEFKWVDFFLFFDNPLYFLCVVKIAVSFFVVFFLHQQSTPLWMTPGAWFRNGKCQQFCNQINQPASNHTSIPLNRFVRLRISISLIVIWLLLSHLLQQISSYSINVCILWLSFHCLSASLTFLLIFFKRISYQFRLLKPCIQH